MSLHGSLDCCLRIPQGALPPQLGRCHQVGVALGASLIVCAVAVHHLNLKLQLL